MNSAASPQDGDKTAARWSLQLLGAFRLGGLDGEPVPLPGKRERVLLAYLANAPNHRASRRKLATLLWGDGDDLTLLDNLRVCLWGLRKALNDTEHQVLISQDESISLDPRLFEVDAWTFRRLAGQSDRVALETAASLYAGEFLEGLTIESEDFQSWARDEGGRFRDLAIDVLDRLMARLIEAGETERAIDTGQRIVRLDPLHEGAVRRLMRLYADSNRRAAAFQLYRSLAETLKTQLNADPEAETRRLLDEISRGNFRPNATEQPAAQSRPPDPASPALPEIPAAPTPSNLAPALDTASPRQKRPPLVRAGIAALVVIAAAAFAAIYLPTRTTPEPVKFALALPEKPSIAVLPFENLSRDTAQDDLAEALTNDITTALSIASEMFVIDRSSMLAFRDNKARVTEVASQLGVRYVLEGSVQRSSDMVRVSMQLVDGVSGRQIWAERYDREAKDTLALQDEIAQAVLTALQVQLTEGEQERIALVHGTKNLEAWIIAGQGLKLLRRLTPEDNSRARDIYLRAIALDPNYAGAVDGLAWTYMLDVRFGWTKNPAADLAKASELGEKALALDPTRSRVYSLLGILNDHAQAVSYGEKAVALDPNASEIAALLALTLTYTDDVVRSPELMARAMRLSPYYPDWYRSALGRSYRLLGRYKEAEAVLKAPPTAGAFTVPQLVELAATLVEENRDGEARAIGKEILTIAPDFSVRAWTANPPHQNAMVTQREHDILLRAGLPEG